MTSVGSTAAACQIPPCSGAIRNVVLCFSFAAPFQQFVCCALRTDLTAYFAQDTCLLPSGVVAYQDSSPLPKTARRILLRLLSQPRNFCIRANIWRCGQAGDHMAAPGRWMHRVNCVRASAIGSTRGSHACTLLDQKHFFTISAPHSQPISAALRR